MIFITLICHGIHETEHKTDQFHDSLCEVKLKNINMEKVFTFNFCSSNAYEISWL